MPIDEEQKIIEAQQRLICYEGHDKVVHVTEVAQDYQDMKANMGRGLPYGLKEMNKVTGNIMPGSLTVISGSTGNGKSLFAVGLSNDFSLLGAKPLWFPLEMGFSIIDRFVEPLPDIYMPKTLDSCNLDWIEERIHESVLKNETKVVILDHIGYVETSEKRSYRNQNYALELTDIIRECARIGKRYGVAMIVIAHCNDVEDRPPVMEDVQYSKSINKEADLFFTIWRLREPDTAWRDKVYTKQSMISLEKNRYSGILKKVKIVWDRFSFREVQ